MGKIVQTAGRNALNEFAPQFAHFNDDVLFGENWNNQDIDVKIRSIIRKNVVHIDIKIDELYLEENKAEVDNGTVY